MSLPIDARAARRRAQARARRRCARAKAVGEEYEGVEVATATVRARRAGRRSCDEARRRGVEAIVLAAEEPSRIRGGALLGGTRRAARELRRRDDQVRGRQGAVPRDPDRAARRPATTPTTGRATADRAAREQPGIGHRVPRSACAVASLESGAHVHPRSSAPAASARRSPTSALRAGHEVSVLDEDPLSHERLDVELEPALGGRRRPVHDRHGARDRRADRGRHRAGRRVHRLDRRRQHEPRDRADRPAALRGRRRWSCACWTRRARGLVRGAGAADDLPDPDRDRACSSAPRSADQEAAGLMYVIIVGAGKVGLEPRPRADRQGPRGHADRARPRAATWPSRRSSSTPSSTATGPSCGCSSAPASSAPTW